MVRLCFRPLCFSVYLGPGWISTPCRIHCNSSESRLTSTSRVASLYSSATTGVIFLVNSTCCSNNEFEGLLQHNQHSRYAYNALMLNLHDKGRPRQNKEQYQPKKISRVTLQAQAQRASKISEEPCPPAVSHTQKPLSHLSLSVTRGILTVEAAKH